MLFLRPFLLTVLVPLITSGVLFFVLRTFMPKLAAPFAVVLGYLAAYVAVVPGLPNLPPIEFKDYIFYLAVLGLLWGALETLWSKNTLLRWLPRSLLLLGILALVLRNRLRAWETWEAVLWFAGITVFFLLAWGALEQLTKKMNEKTSDGRIALPAAALLTALVILVTGSSITTVTSGSASLGQLGGAFAASMGALMLVSWFVKVEITPYFATAFIFVLGVLWFGSSVFAKVPAWSAMLLALSPLVLLFARTAQTLRGHITRLALFSIPIVLVLAYAIWQFILDMRQPAF